MTERDLDLESRRAIYQEIADSPGVHFRGLLDTLSYAQGTLQYHLRQLADESLIDVSQDGKYTRYYPAADFDEADQTEMNALRREYSRRILAHLFRTAHSRRPTRATASTKPNRLSLGISRNSPTPTSSPKSGTDDAWSTR